MFAVDVLFVLGHFLRDPSVAILVSDEISHATADDVDVVRNHRTAIRGAEISVVVVVVAI